MSAKQDRQGARTVTDLERKYNFGQTFAEVFGLISDAQRAATNASNAVAGLDEKLNHEEIFNRLTDNGKVQGIYRGDNDDIYINATYIKSGKLAADRIDADNLKVKAANITGSLTIGQLPSTVAETTDIPNKVSQLTNDSKYQTESGVTSIIDGRITTDYIEALGITVDAANITGLLSAAKIKLGGVMNIYQSLESDTTAGTIGYEAVSYGSFFNGSALGIRGEGHSMVTAKGSTLIYSGGATYIGAESGISIASNGNIVLSGKDLMWGSKSIIQTIDLIYRAVFGIDIS